MTVAPMTERELHAEMRRAAGLDPLPPTAAPREAPTDDGGVRDDERYRIYALRDGERRTLADTGQDGIGIALVTLRGEGEFDEHDRIGIRDRQERRWIVNPWARGTS